MLLHVFYFVVWIYLFYFELVWRILFGIVWKQVNKEKKKKWNDSPGGPKARSGRPAFLSAWAARWAAAFPPPRQRPREPADEQPSSAEPGVTPLPPFFRWQVGPGCQMLLPSHVTKPVTSSLFEPQLNPWIKGVPFQIDHVTTLYKLEPHLPYPFYLDFGVVVSLAAPLNPRSRGGGEFVGYFTF
jgi:hypothetical protein